MPFNGALNATETDLLREEFEVSACTDPVYRGNWQEILNFFWKSETSACESV
jgi:hypothetical protein